MLLGLVILHCALLKICILCRSHRDLTRPDTPEPKLLLYASLGVDLITCILLFVLGLDWLFGDTATWDKKEDTTHVRKQSF